MPIGPGKYDDLCTLVRERAKAGGAIVIVFGGEHGNGFSMQADADHLLTLPEILEDVAARIRRDLERGKV